MSGSFPPQDLNNPNVPETKSRVADGLVESAAANDRYKREAKAFFVSFGADVLDGHPTVGGTDGNFKTPGGITLYDAGVD
jgi:hypothetical protein